VLVADVLDREVVELVQVNGSTRRVMGEVDALVVEVVELVLVHAPAITHKTGITLQGQVLVVDALVVEVVEQVQVNLLASTLAVEVVELVPAQAIRHKRTIILQGQLLAVDVLVRKVVELVAVASLANTLAMEVVELVVDVLDGFVAWHRLLTLWHRYHQVEPDKDLIKFLMHRRRGRGPIR